MKIPAFNNLRLIHIGLVKKPAFLFDDSLILRMSHFSKREVELDEHFALNHIIASVELI